MPEALRKSDGYLENVSGWGQYVAQRMTQCNHAERGSGGKYLSAPNGPQGINHRTAEIVKKEHVAVGKSLHDGSFVFSPQNRKPPPPQRFAFEILPFAPLTARISNRSSGVRVSTAVDLSSAFPPAHRVFSTPCGFSCCGVYACLQTREREHRPGGWCSLHM